MQQRRSEPGQGKETLRDCEGRRTDTEPRVHLLRAAVLQQRLNQDIQIFFRGLLSELLLARQTQEEGRETAAERR